MLKRQKLWKTNFRTWIDDVWTSRGKPLDFEDHKYLVQIYDDQSQNIVIMKSAQSGITERTISESLWVCDQLGKNVLYCVDDKTRLLAQKGWVNYKDLELGDEILTLNKDTGLSEWKPLEELFTRKVNTKLLHLHTNKFSAMVTPNHRWIVKNYYKGLRGKYFFTETLELHKGDKYIPRSASMSKDIKPIFENEFVRLVGWVWTDGCYAKPQGQGIKNTSPSLIQITQSLTHNPHKVVDIERMLIKLDASYKRYFSKQNNCVNFKFKGDLAKQVRVVMPEKMPTYSFIKSLTREQLEIFIETSIQADGWRTKDKNGNLVTGFIQKNKKGVDVFTYACALAGKPIRVTKRKNDGYYVIAFYKRNWVSARKLKSNEVDYDGIVWCPKTVNGTFLAERDGNIYWTGNTFPAQGQLSDLVTGRINPAIANSTYLQSRSTGKVDDRSSTKKPERTGLKQVGDGFLYMRGSQSEKQIISVDADMIVVDERDRFNQSSIPYIDKRLLHSDLKWRRYISTPTLPGFGIHRDYLESDQHQWHIKCKSCGLEQHLNWDKNIKVRRNKSKKATKVFIICSECKKPMDRMMDGRWIPQNPDSTIRGYHINGLYNPFLELLNAQELSEKTDVFNRSQFHNQTLGLPYEAKGAKITQEAITRCVQPFRYPSIVKGCTAGVDVGTSLNVIVGKEEETRIQKDDGSFAMEPVTKYVWIGEVNNFFGQTDSLEWLMLKFGITTMVIDIRPETRLVQEFVQKFPARAFGCEYPTKNFDDGYMEWKLDVGMVQVDRTISLDYYVDEFEQQKVILPQEAESIKGFYDHLKAPVRVVIHNETTGVTRARWQEQGADHYFHAGNYERIARQRGGTAQAFLDYYKEEQTLPDKNDLASVKNFVSKYGTPMT